MAGTDSRRRITAQVALRQLIESRDAAVDAYRLAEEAVTEAEAKVSRALTRRDRALAVLAAKFGCDEQAAQVLAVPVPAIRAARRRAQL